MQYTQKTSNNILDVVSIVAGYNLSPIVSDISFSVNYGDIVSFYGANGSGKSTILFSIYGLCNIYKGNITFLGKDIKNLLPHQRQKIGIQMLPQNWQVFPSLTILENIALPSYCPYGAKNTNKLLANINQVLQQTSPKFKDIWNNKISNRLLHPAGELSGGERQVLTIVRSLLGNYKLLLLDEPLQNLSNDLKSSIFELILSLKETADIGVIIIEHDLSFIKKVSTNVLIVENGRISN